jgi:hypothetical protein
MAELCNHARWATSLWLKVKKVREIGYNNAVDELTERSFTDL